jgi:iron complex outermembrane recepter protein
MLSFLTRRPLSAVLLATTALWTPFCASLPLAAQSASANTVKLQDIEVDAENGKINGKGNGNASAPAEPRTQPKAQIFTTLDIVDQFRNTPSSSIGSLLQASPGVSVKQGNGPRDVGISIRGSNARNGFGVRNIVVFEDGFPVTQPDGLSRTDITDPRAYGAIDVVRGPSSALFGNYATGGAVNFRMRPGGAINGIEYGLEGGSNGYMSNYLLFGKKTENFEGTLFTSDVRGQGHISHSNYNTETVNFLGTYSPTTSDKFTVKFINNFLWGSLPIRQSLTQFRQNPLQKGCETAATAMAGCGTVNLFNNGFSGATTPQTADQAGLNRQDRRTILGGRWEHNFDNDTVWRTQAVYDDRNINQPTGATSAIGDFPSYNISTDITRKDRLMGMEFTHFAGLYFNTMSSTSDTFNVAQGGGARLGRISANTNADVRNMGFRFREEIKFNEQWTGVAGINVERTKLKGLNTLYAYPGGLTSKTFINADRDFSNVAPEAGLLFQPNKQWQFRARVGTGYGTPTIGNLFITPSGVAGNNTQLEAQKNLGYDVGVDWSPTENLKLSATGFYEYFRNELVSQSPGAGLQSYTFNAPKSEHRGIELAADWRFLDGWRVLGAYTYNDQYYTEYTEQLSAGALTRQFLRNGNKIPGVSPQEASVRLGYDQPTGQLKGLGAYAEVVWKDSFYMDNGNQLKAPGYEIVNINVHYATSFVDSFFKDLNVYFEVKNVFDKSYVASANNISNSINAGTGLQNGANVLINSTGSIYAGAPRSFMGGMKLTF